MKNKYWLFLFIFFIGLLIFPNLINAQCSDQQIHELNKLIDNIQFKYEHTGNNLFKVTLYNIPENITGTCTVGMFNDITSSNPKNFVDGFMGGYNYQIFYIANDKNDCGKALLKTVSIKIPVYNVHSKKDICKDKKYSDFEYCNEFLDKEINEEEFNKYLNEYKLSNTSKKVNKIHFFQNVKNFVSKNLLIICVSIILIISSIMIFNKRKK